jgi:hypothetical protein
MSNVITGFLDIRLKINKHTEIVESPDGEVIEEWSYLRPLSLERLAYSNELFTDEQLEDLSWIIAETDTDLETLCNGTLELIAKGGKQEFNKA